MPNASSQMSLSLVAERYDRFARFIRSWCTLGMPGTTPFFTVRMVWCFPTLYTIMTEAQALWAIMRLQVVSEQLGGAGANRIDWELDDAVFKESAGKDFMLEAIDVLKGVIHRYRQSSLPFTNP